MRPRHSPGDATPHARREQAVRAGGNTTKRGGTAEARRPIPTVQLAGARCNAEQPERPALSLTRGEGAGSLALASGGLQSRRARRTVARMDEEHARRLLDAERTRITEELRGVGVIAADDDLSTTDLADSASDLYQEEVDVGRLEELRTQLAALERAEERLRTGRYGLSVESGERIPDERLEIVPTAERTQEEQERFERR
jgi:DnaK suppressor protein